MSATVTEVTPDSPAALAGVIIGDSLIAVNAEPLRDVIQYQLLTDDAEVELEVERGGVARLIEIVKSPGQPLGLMVESAVFDQVRTCDNHCPFCFIYQLPKGMRKSLYQKDDDFRLSFLYGNFTTLTRFTEVDLERVITEQLSPLYVSIHATDPETRTELLRNRRGATSLRWLRALLDHDIEVHGQVVVCPGVNDGDELDRTLHGILDRFPELASVAVVPLGVSRHSNEPTMRPHTTAEAETVIDVVNRWQQRFTAALGRRLVFVADEYYILADRPFPESENYEGFDLHEDGIGMARTLQAEFLGLLEEPTGPQPGFFSWVDGAPAEGYRAPRCGPEEPVAVTLRPRSSKTAVLTSEYGAKVIAPLVADLENVRVVPVDNQFFGGNIGVTGLLVGEDLARVLSDQPAGDRYLLPDVCLSGGTFLDGTSPEDLPHPVEIIATNGIALRDALTGRSR